MLALLTGMTGLAIALVAAGCGGHGSTSNGQLKPLFAMPPGVQNEFLAWLFQLDGSNRWADRTDAAGRRARQAASCPKA